MQEGYIVSQGMAVIAFTLLVLSVWCKKRKQVLLFQILGCSVYMLQYLLLQFWTGYGLTGAVINLIGVIRTIIFIKKVPGEGKYKKILALFLNIYIIATIITWNGIGSIFSFLTGVSSTIGHYNSNTNKIRFFACVTCMFWMMYDIYIGAYVAMFGEICIIISNVISTIVVGANNSELNKWKDC